MKIEIRFPNESAGRTYSGNLAFGILRNALRSRMTVEEYVNAAFRRSLGFPASARLPTVKVQLYLDYNTVTDQKQV